MTQPFFDPSTAQTSRQFPQYCIRRLYHDVKLSYHQDGAVWSHSLRDVESDNPERSWNNREVPTIFHKQFIFIRTILSNPDCALWVRKLSWTFVTTMEIEEFGCCTEDPVWKCFRAMKHVETLDFQSMSFERERHTPPALFASANDVRLGGLMSFALATSILFSIDPSKLTCIELDNLQDLGQLRKGTSLLGNEDLSILRETRYPNKSPKVRHPGPMRDHLKRLTGKCSALRSLTLRSVGQDSWSDEMWSAPHDVARYEEWAAFIDSVRSTLQMLHYEQGKPPTDRGHQPGCNNPHSLMQRIRPMDHRFITYISSVLIRGRWPKLERLVIKGVGGTVRHAWSKSHLDTGSEQVQLCHQQLQQAFSPETELIFENEASKTFYHRDRCNPYGY